MKIVFFGTPDYVTPILDDLNKEFREKQGGSPIEAVVTQEPKETGRAKLLKFSAVDYWAYKRNIPKYFNPKDLIENNIKADIGVLASYGKIIPKEVINLFQFGILVIHPSLLPEFRGSSPVPAAIITNTNPTGVTIFKMDEKVDHGPIVCQFKEEIKDDDNYEILRNRLFSLSSQILVKLIPAYTLGKIKIKTQDDSKAIFTRIIAKEDSFIPPDILNTAIEGKKLRKNWEIKFIQNCELKPDAEVIERFYKAMQPWPGIWTNVKLLSDKVTKVLRLKILKVHIEKSPITNHKSPITKLILDEVQLEGKNPVSWKQFIEGYPEAKFI